MKTTEFFIEDIKNKYKYKYNIHIFAVCALMILISCTTSNTHSQKDKTNLSLSELNLEKAAQLNMRLGLAYLKQNQMSRAKSKLNRALKLAPHLSEVHYGMAFYFEEVGEVELAKKAYQRSIALNPKGGIEHNNYGVFLYKQQEYKASEKEFLTALRDPEYLNAAQALENAGLCVLAIPDKEKAIDYFKRALKYNAKSPQALIELAYLFYFQGNLESAVYYSTQYNQIEEPTAKSLWLDIQLANQAEDKNRSETQFQVLKNRFPYSKEYKEYKEYKELSQNAK